MNIKLSLIKSIIFESVKNETYQKGVIDKSIDPKATVAAYHEQAGNEEYHERMLSRAFYTNLEDLKSYLGDYLTSDGNTTGDNIFSDEKGDVVTISLEVSDRFNTAYTDTLSKLSAKYIEESMLADWWKPIDDKRSAFYTQFVEKDLTAIRRCFIKTAPKAPSVPYTTKIELTGSAIEMAVGEESTVTYTLDDSAVDDIEIRIEDHNICSAGRSREGFTVKALQMGHTYIELYSRHNEDIKATVHVFITTRH